MTLNEYYNFPEGTNATLNGVVSPYDPIPNAPLPSNCERLFNYPLRSIYKYDTSQVTSMYYMFGTSMEDITGLKYWDTSKVTDMRSLFYNCSKLYNFNSLKNWDTSKVTNMANLFYGCSNLEEANFNWDTSKVTSMYQMFYNCSKLTTVNVLNCSSITSGNYPLYRNSTVTTVGGFIDMKSSWNNSYGLAQCPNLTYQSCINILNGLYDFKGQTPGSSEGQLKVHANFLSLVGDEISIGTNKGWTITT